VVLGWEREGGREGGRERGREGGGRERGPHPFNPPPTPSVRPCELPNDTVIVNEMTYQELLGPAKP